MTKNNKKVIYNFALPNATPVVFLCADAQPSDAPRL